MTPNDITIQRDEAGLMKEEEHMVSLKGKLYIKTLGLLSNLEKVKPLDSFRIISNDGSVALINIRGFNDNPEEKLGVEITQRLSRKIEYDDQGRSSVVAPALRHAPTIIFEFNKVNKEVQVYAIYDDRPDKLFGQVKLAIDTKKGYYETGADEELNQKFDEYLDEYINKGFRLE